MNGSFYTAALGASGQQSKIDVLANNISNVNTVGYKSKNSTFTNLLYRNMDRGAGGARLQSGVGVKVNTVATDFTATTYITTEQPYDYAIEGNGFFMLEDPVTGARSYTRNGHFSLSRVEDTLYLVTDEGKRVMNKDEEPVIVEIDQEIYTDEEEEIEEEEEEEIDEDNVDDLVNNPLRIGLFDFRIREGMESIGNAEFVPTEMNGEPVAIAENGMIKGALERSGVDFAKEMAKLVESQRAYSYALKMLQTSDEIESMINSLRG